MRRLVVVVSTVVSVVMAVVMSAVMAVVMALLVAGTGPPAHAAARVPAPATAPVKAFDTTGFRWHDIAATDGVTLKSNVIAPAGNGRHPGVILVASWGLNDFQYLVQAEKLAREGYVVLSYTVRGFWLSGGTIDVGGPNDIADASTAIDWVIANTAVDPRRIAVVGMSYGAGISLNAAARDRRIRAVASLSGWVDLARSMHGEQTRRPQAAFFLEAVARVVGRPSEEMNRVLADYWADRGLEFREQWSRARSAAYSVDALNRNRPAVLISHNYGDSIFPPNQMVDFYQRLTGPKRLELAAGDHATAEIPGLLGITTPAWASVHEWLDRHLKGTKGDGGRSGVVLRPRNSAAVESYATWGQVAARTERAGLSGPRGWERNGDLGGAPTAGWSHTIGSRDTTAGAGVALLSNGFEGLTGIPPMVWLPSVNRSDAGVWVSQKYAQGASVRGVPRLHLKLGQTRPAGTVVAYLYDLDNLGFAKLITHSPKTWVDAGPAVTLDLELQVAAYDVPPGHRLALVVDAKDPLYLDANPDGAQLSFTGESWLDVPLR